MRLIFKAHRSVIIKAAKIALIVGTLLNAINQGEAVASLAFAQIDWVKFALTYCVPFGVSLYTSLSMRTKVRPGTIIPVNLELSCSQCGAIHTVPPHQSAPNCPNCHEATVWSLSHTSDMR